MTDDTRPPEEFEDRDLTRAVFWGVWLRDATFRDVDFTGVRAHHVLLEDVQLDGFVDRLVINGVDVTDHVNAHDPWQPLRGMIRPRTADAIRATWRELRTRWSAVIDRAAELTDEQRRRRVDDEWSFTETLRHLVFVADKWILRPMTGADFHAIGMPNSGSIDVPWPGIDRSAAPTYDEIVEVRTAQSDAIDRVLAELTDDRLDDRIEVLENGTGVVLDGWHTLFEEEFEHLRYALRDLAEITPDAASW